MRRATIATVIAWLALSSSALVSGADVPLAFSDPALQQRYNNLLDELRCLVCQNQSLADSHAELAQDLRDEVHRMVAEGNDSQAVVEFMVARYGDFVLYRPPFKASTWVLWLAPPLLFLAAGIAFTRRSRSASQQVRPLSERERAELGALIAEDNEPS